MTSENIKTLLDTKFIKVYDLEYAPGKHYYNASRRSQEALPCLKDPEEFKKMLPDAVSCFVILQITGREPLLLLSWEYRYPAGQFLLSVPAGLIDPDDVHSQDAALKAASREIFEETNIEILSTDSLSLVNPLVFSTPGMTDESNALVCAIIRRDLMPDLNQDGALGSELFDGFRLVNHAQAMDILRKGRDEHGVFYSLYTWAGLMWFVSGLWK
ncbi:MAG: NUDIX hydrolase [Clostridiales bacterium]|nr:NUDIX hydrolase [Clostridiales bacterium]